MDRLTRASVACGLGVLLTSAGCRTPRPEVPPGRQFTKDGQQQKAIEFSSTGHPASAASTANFMPNNLGGSNLASGIGAGGSRPDGSAFGGPGGSYGPPGTAGMGQPPAPGDPATNRASTAPPGMPPLDPPSAGMPPLDSPPVGAPPALAPAPALDVTPPSRATRPMPNQVIQPPIDTPGQMGTPDQPPSPN